MKFLSFLTAFLLVPVLFVAGVALTLNRTVNVTYLDSAIESSGLYKDAATAIPKLMADTMIDKDSSAQEQAQQKQQKTASIQKVITPAYLRSKVNDAGQKLQSLLKGKASVAEIKLSDLRQGLRGQGIEIKDEVLPDQVIKADDVVQPIKAVGLFDGIKLAAWILAILLLAGSLIIGWRRRRFGAVAVALAITGLLYSGLVAVISFFMPKLLVKIDFGKADQADLQSLEPTVRRLANMVAGHVRLDFVIMATIAFVASIGLIIYTRKLAPTIKNSDAKPSEA